MKLIHLFSITSLLILLISCAPPTSDTQSADQPKDQGQALVQGEGSDQNILKIAIGSKDHTTLVAAVQAVSLENVLANNGPLTVFAPTNAAFDALPEGTVDDLLKPENKDALTNIIWHHAAPGNYQGDLLKDGMKLYQASGHYLDVTRNGDDITVGGAKLLGSVPASNGVVYVIDKVLLPPE